MLESKKKQSPTELRRQRSELEDAEVAGICRAGPWIGGSWAPFSRGLSRVEAGNPGFPRLVQVTSGAFHGDSEKSGKLEVGGASRDSTGFGALEEGLISS